MRYFVFLLPKWIENIILSSTNIEPDYNLEAIYVFQAFKDLCRLHNGRLYTYWNKKYSKNIRFFFFFNSFHNNLSKSVVFHCLQKWRRQILSNSIININCQISRYFFVFLWRNVYLPCLPDRREEWEGWEWLRRKYYCKDQQR